MNGSRFREIAYRIIYLRAIENQRSGFHALCCHEKLRGNGLRVVIMTVCLISLWYFWFMGKLPCSRFRMTAQIERDLEKLCRKLYD